MSEYAFKVKFSCRNCGNKWSAKYEKGHKVSSGRHNKAPTHGPQSTFGSIKKGKAEKVRCPVCNIATDVTVLDRNPIKSRTYTP